MRPKPKFSASSNDFSKVLRQRINAYFKDNNIGQKANTAMHIRTVLLLALWIGSYAVLIGVEMPVAVSYLVWAVLGVSIVWVTINIGHDVIHGAYTSKKWLKNMLSHTFNLNGASAYMWKISHNQAHHSFTNLHGHDEDISPAPFIRISPHTEYLKVQKFQHIYSFFFYGFATISWLLAKDYVQFFGNHINNYDGKKHPSIEYLYLFLYKALAIAIFFVIPMMVLPYHWGHILGGYLLMHFIAGLYLAIIFMLAHAVEEVHFPLPKTTGLVENDWAIHQMATTANFATKSPLASFLSGGLNLQVEHHLFPNIATVHYRAISGIVKTTAREHGVPYYEYPTFWSALRSHYHFLKKLGSQEAYTPVTVATA